MKKKLIKSPIILQVIEANIIGGAQKIAFEISSDNKEEICDFVFLLINKSDNDHRTRRFFTSWGVCCVEVNLQLIRKIPSFRLARFLEKTIISFCFINILLKNKIGLVHFHICQLFYLIPMIRVLSLIKIPIVWTLHGDMNYPASSLLTILSLTRKIKDKNSYFCITKVSQNISENLTSEFVSIGIVPIVIPNGVKLTDYSFSEKSRDCLRNSLNVSQKMLLLGAVGRLEFEKGHDVLIKAFNRIPDYKNFKLVIVGEGSMFDELSRLILSLELSDRILLIGNKENIPDWLSAFDIFVQPSRGEGFGLSILEAMSVGLPIIASDVGGIPALLDNGKAGLLVPPESIAELADAIYTLSLDKDLRQKYSSEALKRAQNFSTSKMINAYKQIYQHLLLS